MNEPPRLRDASPTSLERDLLDAGASYRSSASARRATLAALGLAATASISAGAAAAASSSIVEKLGLVKLLAVLGAGVAVVAPAAYYGYRALADEPPALVDSTPPKRVVEPPALPAPSPVAEPDAVPEPAATVADAPQTRREPSPLSSGALSAELGMLDIARSKLASGDARGALAALDDYARAFPRGRLDLEAEVLRIDALGRAGDTRAAKRRAEAFLKRHPKSVLASRVRRYLESER